MRYRLTRLLVAGDCNVGYDIDACDGGLCRPRNNTALREGLEGVDNALAAAGSALAEGGSGAGLRGANELFSDALCGRTDAQDEVRDCSMEFPLLELALVVDQNVEEGCARVEVLLNDAETGSALLNLSSPTPSGTTCMSGALGTIPMLLGDARGSLDNTVVRMTLSEAGFSDGILGATVTGQTAEAIAGAMVLGGEVAVGQLYEIGNDPRNEMGLSWYDCDALSGTYIIGGVAE